MARTTTGPSTHHSAHNSNSLLDLPPISALFLIDFDVKAGYTIAWKRSVPGLELEGVVEYKSLPSGLHSVKDDLIYFIHEAGHAGVSAFINVPCDEEEARHARMIAVGVLVPLSFGRLGRAWRHAEALKDMAAKLAVDRKRTTILEAYWEKCKASADTKAPAHRTDETPITSPTVPLHCITSNRSKGHSRNRSASDGAIFQPDHTLSKYHPARSLTALLDAFGPLIFPIHRAAMLRKRILISCHAPVHEVCNFVYGLSILSNIPQSVANFLPEQVPTHRLRPLFTIGVHDIPSLVASTARQRQQSGEGDDDATLREDDASSGWIACTTDSILAMKETLWDVLITMPPPFSTNAQTKVWPTVECPGKKLVKATQRDLRRFRALKAGLARLGAVTRPISSHGTTQSEASLDIRPSTSGTTVVDDECDEALDKIVEPATWAELAYGGFMWWASAGEQHRSYEHDEAVHDASLLADWAPMPATGSIGNIQSPGILQDPMTASIPSLNQGRGDTDQDNGAQVELAIIAFFHRLTIDILTVIGDAVEADDTPYTDDDSDNGDAEARLLAPDEDEESRPLRIDSTAFELMGLDVWNPSDAEFIKEVARVYFDRSVRIEGKGIEVCGLRVC